MKVFDFKDNIHVEPDHDRSDGIISVTSQNPEVTVSWEDGNSNLRRDGLKAGKYYLNLISEESGCQIRRMVEVPLDRYCYKLPKVVQYGHKGFQIVDNPCVTFFSIKIMDKWGQPIYESEDMGKPWYPKRGVHPAGTYFYLLTGQFANGEEKTFRGDFQVN